MANGRHYENRKIVISRRRFDRSPWHLLGWRMSALRVLPVEKLSNVKKSKMADGCHFKNRNIVISRQRLYANGRWTYDNLVTKLRQR